MKLARRAGDIRRHLQMRALVISLLVLSCDLCVSNLSYGAQPALDNHTTEVKEERRFAWWETSVDRARATYPEARERFLAGLPEGHVLDIAAKITDAKGHVKEILITAVEIKDGWVTGHRPDEMDESWEEYLAEPHTFREEDITDWVIVRPNGVTEGNFRPSYRRGWFTSSLSGTGATCSQAELALEAATRNEAASTCASLDDSARPCGDEEVFVEDICQWDESIQSYHVKGVWPFLCCL
jgi:hypothetical protein